MTTQRSRDSKGWLLPTHGYSGTPEYRTWWSMLQRCTNPSHTNYWRYGGRGITVCDRWMGPNGFVNFLADMGNKPTPQHQIDRIDGDLGYARENCRWLTPKENSRRRPGFSRMLTFRGEIKCLTEWAEQIGITANALWMRLQAGYSIEKAITTPLRVRKDSTCAQANSID